jgi:hypothetical protein
MYCDENNKDFNEDLCFYLKMIRLINHISFLYVINITIWKYFVCGLKIHTDYYIPTNGN